MRPARGAAVPPASPQGFVFIDPRPKALSAAEERRRANAAVLAMQAARPLKPPPYQFDRVTRTAAECALAEDRRKGLIE